jgi:hypothetical protein
MGWTSFNLSQPVKQWFSESWGEDYEVLDSALVKRNTLYGAIRKKSTQEVFCAVFLIRWSRDYYNFSYKDMTEFAGPCEVECPKRIMKLLTPLDENNSKNQFAIKWRKSVNEYWELRDMLKRKDVCIKTKNPVEFTSGARYQYFKKIGRKTYAGVFEFKVFKPSCRVRVNLNHYETEALECMI